MSAPDLKLVTLNESNFRDPVAALRKIADEIEAGDFGAVGSVGVVLFGDTMEVFGMGVDAEPPSIALLLHAGFMRLSQSLERHGQE
jgi:hypothetical protein